MLLLENICKSFPGVRALTHVNLQFIAGQVHAICGENGAGKSTLMNIVTGNLQPDIGNLIWKAKKVIFKNVAEARALGIAIVYQEQNLVNALSVAQNIFTELPLSRFGWVDYTKLYEKQACCLRN